MKRAYLAAVLGLSIAVPALAQDKPLLVDGPTEMERNMVRMWSRENIEEAPYTYFGFGADHTTYWMNAEGAAKRLLIREEYFENQNPSGKPYRSVRSLYDVDCVAKNWRKLSVDTFQNNGLRGDTVRTDIAGAPMVVPADGSDDAFLLATVCK